MDAAPANGKKPGGFQRSLTWVVVLTIFWVILLVSTIVLGDIELLDFFTIQRDRLLAAQTIIFGILLVEVVGRLIVRYFEWRHVPQTGLTLRAVFRSVGYLVISVAVFSFLSSNAALAAGVGSVIGFIFGLATQQIIGNIFAGTLLAVTRVIRINDEITVTGVKGRVQEIGILYTCLDAGENFVFVPSMVMLANALQRRKTSSQNQNGNTRKVP